jgi:glucosamine--fructose-6-phosphate aminotransferase (isomerizing)
MCGISAIIGNVKGYKYMMFALKMLQNRGYDSAGLCGLNSDNDFIIRKFASTEDESAVAKLENYKDDFDDCTLFIAHERWATSGAVTDENSHPHIDYNGRFALVHNGIIENYEDLKNELIEQHNIEFSSETDTEVIVQLISVYYDELNDVQKAIEKTLSRLEGTWGLVIVCKDKPDKLYCARHGSPLLVGFSNNYIMVASEQSGFCKYVNNYICLKNNDLVVLQTNEGKIGFQNMHEYDIKNITVEVGKLTPDPFPHWTIKEIHEQYDASIRAMGYGGRILNNESVRLGGLASHIDYLKYIDHLILLGCGTSYNAGLYSMHTFKEVSGFDTVQIFDGAEFTKFDIPKSGKTALLLLSQSGETKDLHRCIDIAKDNGLFMIGVINVVDSLIAREVNCGVYLNAGKEQAVASTKSLVAAVIVLHLIAVWFAQIRQINDVRRMTIIESLRRLPFDIKNTIHSVDSVCQDVAKYLLNHSSVFILGKGKSEAIAHEAALKLKEIGYIHAEGYSSSALKHGTLALIESNSPIIVISLDDIHSARNYTTIEEVVFRGAYVIGIANTNINDKCHAQIKIPFNQTFAGLLALIPLQLIAYNLGCQKGKSVDYPTNLAKTVNVD